MRIFKYVLSLILFQAIAFGQSPQSVVCSDGFTPSGCRIVSGTFQLALKQLRLAIPGWRWIVVSPEAWPNVATSFGIKPTTPAFSDLGIQSTYVNAALLSFGTKIDENLQRFSNRTGIDRLRWVVAHEAGHILCDTRNEEEAQNAGQRLEAGNRTICRKPVSSQLASQSEVHGAKGD